MRFNNDAVAGTGHRLIINAGTGVRVRALLSIRSWFRSEQQLVCQVGGAI